MASPQTEHGHTRIAHELLRAYIKQDISASEWRCLMALLLDSYGQSRKVSYLTQIEISKMTGLWRQTVNNAIKELVRRGMVIKQVCHQMRTPPRCHQNRTHLQIGYEINKNYDTWVSPNADMSPNADTPHAHVRTRARNGVKDSVLVNSKEKKTPSPSPEVRELIQQFHDCLVIKTGEKIASFPGGALGKLFKRSLSFLPKEELQKRIQNWFLSDESFIVRNGWSATLFISRFSLLKGGPIYAQESGRQGHNLGAAPIVGKYAHLTE